MRPAIYLNELATRVHIANAKWWMDINRTPICKFCGVNQNLALELCKSEFYRHEFIYPPLDRNVGELLMLSVSELAEAMEGHRKNLMDDKLKHRKMFEVELADCWIRLLDIAGGLDLDLSGVLDLNFRESQNIGESLLHIVDVLIQAYLHRHAKQNFEYKIKRALFAILALADRTNCDLLGAFEEKMTFNAVRVDHTINARLAADGKKY